MPAPAVIPAPKAYINAAAVKGFVVELWPVNPLSRPLRGRQRLRCREHSKQETREWFLSHLRVSCTREGARDFYCD